MKLPVAVLGLCLASGLPAFGATVTPSAPLSINVHGDGAQATRLPAYDPNIPIAVAVTNDGQRVDALTIVASGPAGELVSVPLSQAADGTFAGSLSLPDQGTWRLRLTSRAGASSTGTTPIALDVHAPPPSNAGWIGVGVGAGVFVVIGGGGFLLLRRTVGEPPAELEEAA